MSPYQPGPDSWFTDQQSPECAEPRNALNTHLRLEIIANNIAACTKCDLHKNRTQAVFSRGHHTASVMFVGEAPGADEDEQGLPFVGRAGQLLDRMTLAMGLQPGEAYLANICRCRPLRNRIPTDEEMATCAPYLHEQIALVQPRVIVALGATATKGLLNSKVGIKALRGHWKLYNGEIPVMPTYHPAFLLRETEAGNLNAKREVWRDLQQVMERLGRPAIFDTVRCEP